MKNIEGGCLNCKHHKSYSGCTNPNVKKKVSKDWWKANGKKTRNDILTTLTCFEPTELSLRLDKMNDLLDQMLDLIKES